MNTKRKRIGFICSSSNYNEDHSKYKKLRSEYIKAEHNRNIEIVKEISSKITIEENKITVTQHKQAYIKVFGKLIPITQEEANNLPTNITIIWQ